MWLLHVTAIAALTAYLYYTVFLIPSEEVYRRKRHVAENNGGVDMLHFEKFNYLEGRGQKPLLDQRARLYEGYKRDKMSHPHWPTNTVEKIYDAFASHAEELENKGPAIMLRPKEYRFYVPNSRFPRFLPSALSPFLDNIQQTQFDVKKGR
jgi:hypothetical protein